LAVHSNEPGFVCISMMDCTEYTAGLWNVFLNQCILQTYYVGESVMMWEGYVLLCR